MYSDKTEHSTWPMNKIEPIRWQSEQQLASKIIVSIFQEPLFCNSWNVRKWYLSQQILPMTLPQVLCQDLKKTDRFISLYTLSRWFNPPNGITTCTVRTLSQFLSFWMRGYLIVKQCWTPSDWKQTVKIQNTLYQKTIWSADKYLDWNCYHDFIILWIMTLHNCIGQQMCWEGGLNTTQNGGWKIKTYWTSISKAAEQTRTTAFVGRWFANSEAW